MIATAVLSGSPTAQAVTLASTPTAQVTSPQIGSGGFLGYEHTQAALASVWTVPVPASLNRLPAVTIYLDGGEPVIVDYVATETEVIITFPRPYTGKVVIT